MAGRPIAAVRAPLQPAFGLPIGNNPQMPRWRRPFGEQRAGPLLILPHSYYHYRPGRVVSAVRAISRPFLSRAAAVTSVFNVEIKPQICPNTSYSASVVAAAPADAASASAQSAAVPELEIFSDASSVSIDSTDDNHSDAATLLLPRATTAPEIASRCDDQCSVDLDSDTSD